MGLILSRMLFLTMAGALSAQTNQWYDFLRELDTSVRSPDVDNVEKKAEWIGKYLERLGNRLHSASALNS